VSVAHAEPLAAVTATAAPDIAACHFAALGTSATVAVTNRAHLRNASGAVRRRIEAFDRACSRFRPDSELSALNAAAGRPVAVGALLFEAITAAVRAAELTDGHVDPTVGRALIALGYDRDFSKLGAERLRRPDSPAISIASIPGWRTVTIDRDARTIRVPRGVTIDLGATAKALCADRAAAEAAAAAACGVLVSLGGDVATAGGSPSEGWPVRVTDDHRDGLASPGQWIALTGGGLATSSTTARRWQTRSGEAHHLVDPTTGRPVDGPWRTATVAAATCLDANTASTAAIIRGHAAEEWLSSLSLPSRLVGVDGKARHLAGWPGQGDELT
jgi:thiamine biosynthesis lipoprotein